MEDQDKTKEQRIELVEMRQQIAELQEVDTQRKQAEEALELRVEQLAALSQASQVVTASLELDQVLAGIVSLASEVVAADYTSVVLVDAAGNIGRSAEDLPGVPGMEYRIRDEGLTRWIVCSRQAGVIDEIGYDGAMIPNLGEGAPRFANPPIVEAGVKSVAGLPLMVKDCLLGVLYLHSLHAGAFHGQLPLLTAFANQMAIAIDNARLYEALKQELAERKRAEEEICRLSQFQESIIDNANVWLNVLDERANVVLWNKAAEEISGYSREEVGGHGKIWEWLYPDEEYCNQVKANAIAIIERGGEEEENETTIRCKDGQAKIISWNSRSLVDEKGNPIGSIALARDITERRRAVEALRESEEKYRTLVEGSINGIAIVQGLEIRFVNQALLEMFDFQSEDEMVGHKFTDFISPEDRNLMAERGRAREKGEDVPTRYEFKGLRKDGTEFDAEISVSSIAYQGSVARQGIVRDITERKRAEEALRESEQRFRELVENANDVIYTHDPEGNFTSANPAATRIYGYTHEEILQLNIAQIVDPEYLPLAQQRIQEKLEGSARTGPYELLTYSKEGDEPIWVEVSTRLLEREDLPIGVLGIARDITGRKRAEEALQESEEKYRNLVERANDGIAIIQDRIIKYTNSPLAEIWGGTVEEIIGTLFTDYVHPDELPKVLDRYKRRMAGKDVTPIYEAVLRRRDGSNVYAELNAGIIVYEGKPANLVFIRNITGRKRAAEELRQSYVKLERTLEGTVHALVAAIEMRDPYTAGHQRRVTQLTCAIAKEMGLDGEQIEGVRMAGLIHDIGKINVPAEILSKPSPLTELEYGLIKMHPQIGHDVLKTIEFPWPVAQIVLQHHERMDGSGYPQGLSGEEIVLEARILSVADVVEAMASHRPYRAPRGIDEALEEISRNRGVLYDPEVVDACLKLFSEMRFKLE